MNGGIALRVSIWRGYSVKKRSDCLHSGPRPTSVPYALLSDGTIPVDAAALKEAMMDHAVAKQQEEDC